MKTVIETITPEQAKKYLALSPDREGDERNRRLSKHAIDKYAASMKAGDWALNGESIKFDTRGLLRDGQNRLSGCVQSGVPFKTLVCYGVPDDCFPTIDVGKTRTGGDILYMAGEVNATILSAAVSHFNLWATGEVGTRLRGGRKEIILPIIRKHEGLRHSASVLASWRLGYQGPTAALHYVFGLLTDVDEADAFIKKTLSGVGLEEGSPMLTLRNCLIQRRLGRQMIHVTVHKAFVVRAWNAYIERRTLRLIKWAAEETFPRISSGSYAGQWSDDDGCRPAPFDDLHDKKRSAAA